MSTTATAPPAAGAAPDAEAKGGRKKLIIGAGIAVALVAAAVAISMRGGGDTAAAPAPGAVAPVVTVTSPGQSTVARTVSRPALVARFTSPSSMRLRTEDLIRCRGVL